MIINYLPEFPRRYDAEVLDELPAAHALRFYYPGASQRGGRDGLLVAVRPEIGEEWLGVFAFGSIGRADPILSSTPNKSTLCVVASAEGYLVRADDPKTWSTVPIIQITDFRPIPERQMIVMASYTHLAALGADGLLWRTDQISWDGITITNIGEGYIEGKGWDPTTSVRPTFRVDLQTSHHEGGSSPAKYGLTSKRN
jgi:hypothetical protein